MVSEDEFDRWMKVSEWRGKTYQALEDIGRELSEIKKEIKDCKKEIRGNTRRLTGIQIKVASIGGVVSLIVTILVSVVL